MSSRGVSLSITLLAHPARTLDTTLHFSSHLTLRYLSYLSETERYDLLNTPPNPNDQDAQARQTPSLRWTETMSDPRRGHIGL